MRILVPVSGGLDSTVALYSAEYDVRSTEVHAIAFDYGQRHLKELAEASWHCQKLEIPFKIINVGFFKDVATSALTDSTIDVPKTKDVLGDPQTAAYVPYRNLMMISICAAYCESNKLDTIYYGSAQIDSQAGYWDSSTEFYTALKSVLDLNRRDRVTVETPLINMSKKEIVEAGVSLGVDFSHTWTCYNGLEKACGECPSCSSRIKGFLDAGIKDPIEYLREDIPWNI